MWTGLSIAGVFLLYSSVSIVSKYAARSGLFSFGFFLLAAAAVLCMGIYAIIWQQFIKKVDLSFAYSFKGLTVIYGLLWGALLFGESISLYNIAGALVILLGVFIAGQEEHA